MLYGNHYKISVGDWMRLIKGICRGRIFQVSKISYTHPENKEQSDVYLYDTEGHVYYYGDCVTINEH